MESCVRKRVIGFVAPILISLSLYVTSGGAEAKE